MFINLDDLPDDADPQDPQKPPPLQPKPKLDLSDLPNADLSDLPDADTATDTDAGKSQIRKVVETLNTAPKFITNRTRIDPEHPIEGGIFDIPGAIKDILVNTFSTPSHVPGESTADSKAKILMSMMKASDAGTLEGVGELATPINIADLATMGGKSALLKGANRVISGLVGASGVEHIAEGNTLGGLAELAGGTFGAVHPFVAGRAAKAAKAFEDARLAEEAAAATRKAAIQEPIDKAGQTIQDFYTAKAARDERIAREVAQTNLDADKASTVNIQPPEIEPWDFNKKPADLVKPAVGDTTGGFHDVHNVEETLDELGNLTDKQKGLVKDWLGKYDDVRDIPELPGNSKRSLERNQKLIDAFVEGRRTLSAGQADLGYPHNVAPRRFMPSEVQTDLLRTAGRAIEARTPRPSATVTPAYPEQPKVNGVEKHFSDFYQSQADKPAKKAVAKKLDTAVDALPDGSVKNELNQNSSGLAKEVSKLDKAKDLGKTVKDQIFSSGQQQLENMGPVGQKISKVLRDSETASSVRGGQYVDRLNDVRSTLNPSEELDVAKMLDGQTVDTPSAASKSAYKELRGWLNEIGDEAVANGVTLKNPHSGARMLFEKFKGEYFPRRYKKEVLDTLMNDKSKARIEDRLVAKEGITPAEAKKRVQNMVKFGERYTDSQIGRTLTQDLPHDMSLDVLEKYAYEMSRRIEETKRLGALDIGHPKTPISQLVNQLPGESQRKATDIISDYLGRNVRPDTKLTNAAGTAARIEVASKLTNFFINNLGDFTRTITEAGWRPTLKEIAKAIYDSKSVKKSATSSGAFEIFHNNVLQDPTFGSKWTKLYGLEGMESFIRGVGANVGKALAETKFNALKQNPGNKVLRQELSSFIDGDLDTFLKKSKMTKEDLNFAGGRFVELTSGKPNALTLPPAFFASNPLARLPLLFKRFAFVASKSMKDTFSRSIVKDAPFQSAKAVTGKAARLMSASVLLGELTGDTIAGIKGAISPDDTIEGAIASRGDLQKRVVKDMMQSWMFGMIGDAAQATSSRTKLADFLMGPVYADAVRLGSAGYSAAQSETAAGKPRDWETRLAPIRNFAAQNIPVPVLGKGIGSILATSPKPKNSPNFFSGSGGTKFDFGSSGPKFQ